MKRQFIVWIISMIIIISCFVIIDLSEKYSIIGYFVGGGLIGHLSANYKNG